MELCGYTWYILVSIIQTITEVVFDNHPTKKKAKNYWTCLVAIIVYSYLDNIHTFTSIASTCSSKVSSSKNISEERIRGFNSSPYNNSTKSYCKLIWVLLVQSVNACSRLYALSRLKAVSVSPIIFSTTRHYRININ